MSTAPRPARSEPGEENDDLLGEYHFLIDKELDNQLSDTERLRMGEINAILAKTDEWEARQVSTRARELDNTEEMQELRKLNLQIREILEAMHSIGNNEKKANPTRL